MLTIEKNNREKYGHAVFALILFTFLIFNLWDLSNYGISWDEPVQHKIGMVAKNYIEGRGDLQFEAPFAPDLVYYGPFFQIADQYLASLLISVFNIPYIDAHHVLIVITATLGLFYLYKLASLLFSQKIALWASVFLILSPKFLAHAHYNPKDIPILTGAIMVFYLSYSGFKSNKIFQIIFAGIILGIVSAIRLDALIILPIIACSYSVKLFFGGDFRRELLKFKSRLDQAFYFLLSSVISLFLTWPATWHNYKLLGQAINNFFYRKFIGNVLYLGKIYWPRDLPWHYSSVSLAMATPLIIIIFSMAGLYFISKKIKNRDGLFEYSLLFFWLLIPLVMESIPGTIRYDGIRHFLLVIPAISIVAALGLEHLASFISTKLMPGVYIALGAFILIWLVLESCLIYPFGDSYFNEPTRLILGPHLERKVELEYWGVSYRQGIGWLNQNAEFNSRICVPSGMGDFLILFYPVRKDILFECSAYTDYVMSITKLAYLDLDEKLKIDPVFKVSRYDSDLLRIYYLKH